MSTAPIVIHLYVFKHPCPHLAPAVPPFKNIQFPFQCFEETLRTGIVPTVALTAHALANGGTALDERSAKIFCAVLHPPVRMKQQPFTGKAVCTSHHKRLAHTVALKAIGHSPAQNFAIPQVN
jgi:hypothetical protein